MLSDEQWQKIADKTGCFITGGLKEAIEAEVRKQDTALIRQLVEALESSGGFWSDRQQEMVETTLAAARARLEGKT